MFSVISLGESGTGVSCYYITFYRYLKGRIKPVLCLPLKGMVYDWELIFNREFEACLFSSSPFDLQKIVFLYSLDYTANPTCYSSRYPDTPSEFPLFSLERKVAFIWDEKKEEYIFDIQNSQLPLSTLKTIFTADERIFSLVLRRK